jgi:HlyD family secretion protein
MNCLRILFLSFLISAVSITAAIADWDSLEQPQKEEPAPAASKDQTAKDEPTPAASQEKPAKNEPTLASPSDADKSAKPESTPTASTDKSAKEEPAPAASKAKSAKEEPASPAATNKPAKEEPAAPPPPTYTVKREPFKIQVELDGVFESREMTEIIIHPEEWAVFSVEEAVEHGARVKKGDVLVQFDPEKIDKAITDLREEQRIAKVALNLAEDQLSSLAKTTPLDLEASRRAQRLAEEDQKQYFEINRPMLIKTMDNMLKFTRQALDYKREELDQLEKMYKADDLTEETEKIVLKRARNDVEKYEFIVEREEYEHDQAVKIQIPRMDEQIKETAHRKNLAWAKDRVELPLALEKLRLDVKRQKLQIARSEEKLKNLLADRELMKIKAPADGYVYYGRCQRGKFNEMAAKLDSFRRGANVQPHQVLFTIVEPKPLFVHATTAEEHLQYLRKDLGGTVLPTGYPDLRLDVTVDEIGKAPVAMGSFDLQLSLDDEKTPKVLMPGMACKIKLVPYQKSDALIVPPKTVITDPLDDQKKFVYLQNKDGKSEKQDVTVGKQTDKQAEILKGLSEGDKILLEAPKDAK